MLDIIIPTYKNKEGLRKTLSSINRALLPEINVTIIDDYSETYYNDILEEFSFTTVFYCAKNAGPGCARNYGMRVTNNPYIMFLDTGDYFVSNEIQNTILQTIKDNPTVVFFSWKYLTEGKPNNDTSNRLHGRVYRRDFLRKYHITFCEESSYTNEDIGFNRLCRLILKDREKKSLFLEEPAVVYSKDENSLTNKNNKAFFFKQQNMGLALNIIHEIKIAKKDYVSPNIILQEINFIMASMYYTFLCTAYERPEFIQEAYDGARLFYLECFSKNTDNKAPEMLKAYHYYLKQIYQRAKSWKNFRPLNFLRFIKDLKTYQKVPSWYIFDFL